MSSPIHKFLFSPPPSPPLAAGAGDANAGLTPLKSVIPNLTGMKRSSPRLDTGSFSFPVPTLPTRSTGAADVEAALPEREVRKRGPLISPVYRLRLRAALPNIPKPVARLAGFVVFLFACAVILSQVILPALYPLPANPVASPRIQARQAAPADYVPPQVPRAPIAAPPPRTFRPEAHPLPPSHELLALQSYVLESPANRLHADYDASNPLDAVDLIGAPGARRLGATGSEAERAWLNDVVGENVNNVVLWFFSAAPPHYALEGVMSRHGHGRRPNLISLSSRKDGGLIRAVLERLGHKVSETPVLVIGGEVWDATRERMDELRESGRLQERLAQIGWH